MNHRATAKADARGRITLGPEFANQHVTVKVDRNIDLDEAEIMRAVHFLDASNHGRASLYGGIGREEAEALIGIDWGTGPVWAHDAFASHEKERAIDDYNAMEKASDGALVAAYYGRRKENINEPDPYNLNDNLVLGVCPSGSTVRAIPVESRGGGTTFVKTLLLVDTVEVTRNERPDMFADFAPGRSVYNTPSKEESIRNLYEDRFY